MTTEPDLTVIVARYVSSEDAGSDLQALDDFYWTAAVEAYDAAVLVTDAWNQVRVAGRSGRRSDDVSVGPLHDAFAALFGGPFIKGKPPAPPPDQRLLEGALRNLGRVLPADAVLLVVIGRTDEPERAHIAFTNAEWFQWRGVEATDDLSAVLSAVIADLIREGAASVPPSRQSS